MPNTTEQPAVGLAGLDLAELNLAQPVSTAGRSLVDLLGPHLPLIDEVAAANDRTGTFPVDLFEGFRKDGVLAATVPEELGGLGVGQLYDVAVALRAVAEVDASTSLALHMQLSRGLTLTYEWRHGTPAARVLAERLLRMMGDGDAVVCGAVKDAPRVITRLTPTGDGAWLLNGRKTLVSMAPVATHLVISSEVQVDGEPPGLAAPVVARDNPGLTVLDNWDGLGMRASGTVDVVFEDCRIEASDVLPRAPIGAHRDAVLAGHTVSSVPMLGIYAGVAQAARDIVIGMLTRRSASPASATRTLVAEMDAKLYALRTAAGSALRNADALAEAHTMDPDERGRRMMTPFQCAKLMVNRLAAEVVDHCLTIVGGAAYSAGHPLARRYRDVRAGGFMQPYTYVDAVDFLSAGVLGLDHDNDYVSVRALRSRKEG